MLGSALCWRNYRSTVVAYSLKTYRDGPPVTKLADSVGQDEDGKPENCQQLREGRKVKVAQKEEGNKKEGKNSEKTPHIQ